MTDQNTVAENRVDSDHSAIIQCPPVQMAISEPTESIAPSNHHIRHHHIPMTTTSSSAAEMDTSAPQNLPEMMQGMHYPHDMVPDFGHANYHRHPQDHQTQPAHNAVPERQPLTRSYSKYESLPREYNTGQELEGVVTLIGMRKSNNPLDKEVFLGFLAGLWVVFGKSLNSIHFVGDIKLI